MKSRFGSIKSVLYECNCKKYHSAFSGTPEAGQKNNTVSVKKILQNKLSLAVSLRSLSVIRWGWAVPLDSKHISNQGLRVLDKEEPQRSVQREGRMICLWGWFLIQSEGYRAWIRKCKFQRTLRPARCQSLWPWFSWVKDISHSNFPVMPTFYRARKVRWQSRQFSHRSYKSMTKQNKQSPCLHRQLQKHSN